MMSAHNINPVNLPSSAAATSVFSDFCQAWGARFPGSELPDAWEEDVRKFKPIIFSTLTSIKYSFEANF